MTDEELKKEKIRLVSLFIVILLFIGLCFVIVFWPSHNTEAALRSTQRIFSVKGISINNTGEIVENSSRTLYVIVVDSGESMTRTSTIGNGYFFLSSTDQRSLLVPGYQVDYDDSFTLEVGSTYTFDRFCYVYTWTSVNLTNELPPLTSPSPEPSPEVSPEPSVSPTPVPPVEPVNFDMTYIYIIIFLLGVTAICMIFRK